MASIILCNSSLSILLAATFRLIFSVFDRKVSAIDKYPLSKRNSVDSVIASRLFPSAKL